MGNNNLQEEIEDHDPLQTQSQQQQQQQQQDETDQQQLEQQQTAQPQIRFLSANVLQQLQQQQDVQQQTQQQQQQPQVITLQNFVPLQAQQPQHEQQRAQAISVQSLPHQFLQVCKRRNYNISTNIQLLHYISYYTFFRILFNFYLCKNSLYFAGCSNY